MLETLKRLTSETDSAGNEGKFSAAGHCEDVAGGVDGCDAQLHRWSSSLERRFDSNTAAWLCV